jgi:hypothetical protein
MPTFAFVLPLLPGKEETDRKMFEQLNGADKQDYIAARRGQGLTRETVWHQKTPMGTFAIVMVEGSDIGAAMGKIATSDALFDRRFRDFIKDVHGIDLAKDPPPDVSLISDTRF